MFKKVVIVTNCLIFFDEKLFEYSEFLQTALEYSEDLSFTTKILRSLSKSAAPSLVSSLLRQYQASNIIVSYLRSTAKARSKRDSSTDNSSIIKFFDIIQFSQRRRCSQKCLDSGKDSADCLRNLICCSALVCSESSIRIKRYLSTSRV